MLEEQFIPIFLGILLFPIILDIVGDYFDEEEEINIGSSWKKNKDTFKVLSISGSTIKLIDENNKIIELKLSTFKSEYEPCRH